VDDAETVTAETVMPDPAVTVAAGVDADASMTPGTTVSSTTIVTDGNVADAAIESGVIASETSTVTAGSVVVHVTTVGATATPTP
jgi:hypothetical protein